MKSRFFCICLFLLIIRSLDAQTREYWLVLSNEIYCNVGYNNDPIDLYETITNSFYLITDREDQAYPPNCYIGQYGQSLLFDGTPSGFVQVFRHIPDFGGVEFKYYQVFNLSDLEFGKWYSDEPYYSDSNNNNGGTFHLGISPPTPTEIKINDVDAFVVEGDNVKLSTDVPDPASSYTYDLEYSFDNTTWSAILDHDNFVIPESAGNTISFRSWIIRTDGDVGINYSGLFYRYNVEVRRVPDIIFTPTPATIPCINGQSIVTFNTGSFNPADHLRISYTIGAEPDQLLIGYYSPGEIGSYPLSHGSYTFFVTYCKGEDFSSYAVKQFPLIIGTSDNTSPGITIQPDPQTVCSGGNSTFNVSASGTNLVYQWQVNTGSGWNDIISAGSNPTYDKWNENTLNISNAGSSNNGYNYRCVVGGSCSPSVTSNGASLTVNPLPTPYIAVSESSGIASNDGIICEGFITTLTATGGNSYSWSTGQTSAVISVNPITSTNYIVTATNSYGCNASTNQIISVNSLPTPTLSASSTSICSGSSVTFTAGQGSGPTITNYNFRVNGSSRQSGPGNIFSTTTLLNGDLVLVEATTAGNCTVTSSSISMTVYAIPSITTSAPGSRCGPGVVSLGANASEGIINWYDVSTGGASLGTGTNFNTPGIGSTTTYYVDATNSGCTTASRSAVTAAVKTIPSITGVTPDSRCGTGIVMLSATASGGMISWYDALTGGSLLNTGNNYTTPTISSSTSYFVDATENGCTTTNRTIVSAGVYSIPVPLISGIVDVCANSSGNVYSTEPGMNNYLWEITGGIITSGGSSVSNFVTVTWNAPGTGVVRVNYANGNDCTAAGSSERIVTVSALPIPGIGGLNNVCANSAGNVYITDSGMSDYTWEVTGGTITAGGTTTSNTVTVTWNGAGTGNIKVNYTSLSGCRATASTERSITINPVPSQPGIITGNNSPCQGLIGQTYSVVNVAGVTYTWSVPADWSITGGQLTSSITVTPGSLNGNITVVPANTCGDGAANTLSVIPVVLPGQPDPISGNGNPCQGSSQTYSVTSVSDITYTWTVPSGWNISSGQNTNTVIVAVGSTAGDIRVTPQNSSGCYGTTRNLAVTTSSAPAQPGIIAGPANPCRGSVNLSYSVTEVAGLTYTWSVPSGWTITSGDGTNSILVTAGILSGNIGVIPTNGSGCIGTARSLSVTTTTVPAQPAAISGNITPCQGSSQTYSVTNVPGVSYSWILPVGWTQTAGGNTSSITVTVGSSNGTIEVTPSNSCGNGTARTLTVTTTSVPSQPGAVTGPISPCQGSSQTYSVTNVPGIIYNWSLPTGWTQTAGATTNSITVTTGSANGSIGVTPVNSCGSGPASTLSVTTSDVPLQPGSVTGLTNPCKGSSQTYSVNNTSGVNYTWTLPSGWIQISGGNTSSIIVTVGSLNGTITVTPDNNCGSGIARTLAVTTMTIPVKPNAISGNSSPCQGTSGLTYSVINVAGVTYIWLVPTGWTITSGQGTNSIIVSVGINSGVIQVTPGNICGDGEATLMSVITTNVPGQPGAISGNPKPCQEAAGTIYSVPNMPLVTYTWSVPADWTITSGQGSNSIVVTAGTSSGIIQVVPGNVCGNGVSSTFPVTTSVVPDPPGAITGSITPCQNASGMVYQVENVTGVNYLWSVPAGWVITAGQGTSSIIVTTGTVSGAVSVIPGNSCGDGPVSTLPVTISILSAGNPVITDVSCHNGNNGEISIVASGGTTPYQYSSDNSSWQTNGQFINLEAKDYNFFVKDVNGCRALPHTVSVGNVAALSFTFQEDKPLCGTSNGSLTIISSGGTSPYEVNWHYDNQVVYQGNLRSGLAAGDYLFTITDMNGCMESFTQNLSNAGGPKLTVSTVNPLCYSGSDGIINLGISDGVFPYNVSLTFNGNAYETRIYNNVSEMVPFSGIATGSYGVAVTDAIGCTSTESVLVGSPDALSASITPSNISCKNDANGSAKVFAAGGTAPYIYNWQNSSGDNLGITDVISNLQAGRYTVGVTDSHGCPVVYTEGITSVFTDIEAPSSALTLGSTIVSNLTCKGGNDGKIRLNPKGGWGDYRFSIDGITWYTDSLFVSLNSGIHQFTVKDKFGCSVTTDATLAEGAQILINIDELKDALCFGSGTGSITLSATGGDGNYSYSIDNGTSFYSIKQFTGLSSGKYSLHVIDGSGCSGNSEVTVSQPDILSVLVNPPQHTACSQSIGNAQAVVTGGVPPYQYNWSNGSTQSLASGLPTGSYALAVTDANGCISNTVISIVNLPGPELGLLSKSDASCPNSADGRIEVSVNGGRTPVTLNWRGISSASSVIENLDKGTYIALATDLNGCRDSITVTISKPDPLVISLQKQTDPLCYGSDNGVLEAAANGGTLPYSFQWSNGSGVFSAGNIQSGTYSVSVTDSRGCLSNASFSLTDPPILKPGLPETVTICTDQSYELDARIPNSTYQWYSGNGFTSDKKKVTVTLPGTYYLIVTDRKGCIGKDTLTLIKESNVIDANFIMAGKVSVGDTLVIIELSWPAPQAIEWNYPASFTSIYENAFLIYLVPRMEGNFNIGLTSFVGACSQYMEKTLFVEKEKNEEKGAESKQSVIRDVVAYPNPTSGDFSVEVNLNREADVMIEVSSIYGIRLFSEKVKGLSYYKFDLNQFLTSGIYFVRIISGNEFRSLRVVVN